MSATTAAPRTTTRPAAAPPAGTAAATTSPRTRLIGGAFLAAPLLAAAGSAALVAGSEATFGVIAFYAFAAFALVVLTLTQVLAPALPRAATALTVLGMLGVAAGVGFSVDGIHAAVLDDAYLVEDGGIAGVFVSQLPGLMFPATWIGIGIALARTGVQPRWSATLLIVAGVLFPISRIGEIAPLALVDDLLFLVALAPLGLAIMRGRDILAAR